MLTLSLASCGQGVKDGMEAAKKDRSTTESVTESLADTEISQDSSTGKDSIKVKHGETKDVTINGTTLVVKAKIKPSLSNELTINQNYINVGDIIINQGGDAYKEIQYWAVADMQSGDEAKVMSFTVPEDTIEGVKDGDIVDIELGDYVDDLYILPSLLE